MSRQLRRIRVDHGLSRQVYTTQELVVWDISALMMGCIIPVVAYYRCFDFALVRSRAGLQQPFLPVIRLACGTHPVGWYKQRLSEAISPLLLQAQTTPCSLAT